MSRFSVKKPMTVFVAVIIVIALGIVSLIKMTPDLLPSIDLPYVVVMTTYPGATPEEVEQQGRLRPDAIHIPLDSLRERLGELDLSKKVYVNCFSGLRSYLACRILSQKGFRCSNLSGGWRLYEAVVRDRTAAQEAWPCGMEK